jgi:hypothetical protein
MYFELMDQSGAESQFRMNVLAVYLMVREMSEISDRDLGDHGSTIDTSRKEICPKKGNFDTKSGSERTN